MITLFLLTFAAGMLLGCGVVTVAVVGHVRRYHDALVKYHDSMEAFAKHCRTGLDEAMAILQESERERVKVRLNVRHIPPSRIEWE